MIIQCDKCSTKFKLDDSRVTGSGVRVRCTKCQNVFIVTPPHPVEEVAVEEVFSPSGAESPARSGKAPEKPASGKERPKGDDFNLKFDFEKPSEEAEKKEEAPQENPPAEPPSPSGEMQSPASFNEIDFSFGRDLSKEETFENPEGKPSEEASGGPAFGFEGQGESEARPGETAEKASQEKAPFSDLDFSLDDRKEEGAEQKPHGGDWSIDAGEEKTVHEEKGKSAGPGDGDKKVVPLSSAYGKDGMPVGIKGDSSGEPPKESRKETLKFSELFSESMAKGESEGGILGEVEEEEEDIGTKEAPERPGSARALLIAAIVFIVGGGIIYFSGVIDTLARRLMPPAQSASDKTVQIETIKGYYAENKNFGKFFVIEALVKNISDSPQSVKAVTGVLYDSKGTKLASRSVAPGRVVSADDLKNLSKEDLLKPFKDPSGGMLPPKGTVPVMVPFTEPPQGITEYGIDIVR